MNAAAAFSRRALALLLALACCALAGCGAQQTETPAQGAAPTDTQQCAAPADTQQSAASANTPAITDTQAPAASANTPAITDTQAPAAQVTDGTPRTPEDGAVHVSSVDSLLEAIAPDREIVIEPGRYDLTEFLRDYPNARDQDEWNEAHRYVKLGFVFDGVEVTITDVQHLSITGGAFDPAETEIVTEPRYAAVLNFEDCSDIELACLTMGHTEMGDCSGNVLDFDNDCGDIFLRSVDLYGCGVYGIRARNCGDLTVSNSTIRDCEAGPVDIEESAGDFLFTACTISGSGGGGNYVPTGLSTLAFVGCYFGAGESTGFYFRSDIAFEHCEWSEPTSYPDREGPLEESFGFYPETMKQVEFDEGCLGRSCWTAFAEVDPQSGETDYFGLMGQDWKPSLLVTLDLNEDGTGTLAFGTEREDVQWEFMDGGVVCRRADEPNAYFSLYRMRDPASGAYRSWMMMQCGGNDVVWLC